jgi:hypothetical protein
MLCTFDEVQGQVSVLLRTSKDVKTKNHMKLMVNHWSPRGSSRVVTISLSKLAMFLVATWIIIERGASWPNG